MLTSGRARLALGRVRVSPQITEESAPAWRTASSTSATTTSREERCGIPARRPTSGSAKELEEPFRRADLPEALRRVDRALRVRLYSLRLVFRDERQRSWA